MMSSLNVQLFSSDGKVRRTFLHVRHTFGISSIWSLTRLRYQRLNPGKKQREPTFQVVLDALALTPCYSAFLITTDVPEVYMHQFWDSIHKYENSYRFRMDKKKKFDLNLEIFRDIFQICPRVHGQNFDALPTDEDIVSFFKELGHTGEIKTITDIVVDQMHQPRRTFATIINRSLSGKTTGLDKLRLSRAQIL
ncbi:hypothetical protein Tco_1254675 [Tanacetum coccineum]